MCLFNFNFNFNFWVFSAPLTRGPATPYRLTLNSSVFNWFLKDRVFCNKRRSTGRSFQAVGPATPNARSPNFNLVRLTANERFDADRSCRPPCSVEHWVTMSFMYEGLWPLIMLCIIRHSLNLMRSRIGSQWRDRNACVMWSVRLRFRTTRAAVWRTLVNGNRVVSGRPASMTLQ